MFDNSGRSHFPGKFDAALSQSQSVLNDLLAKQQAEKDNLARKYKSVWSFYSANFLFRSDYEPSALSQCKLCGITHFSK